MHLCRLEGLEGVSKPWAFGAVRPKLRWMCGLRTLLYSWLLLHVRTSTQLTFLPLAVLVQQPVNYIVHAMGDASIQFCHPCQTFWCLEASVVAILRLGVDNEARIMCNQVLFCMSRMPLRHVRHFVDACHWQTRLQRGNQLTPSQPTCIAQVPERAPVLGH